MTLDLIIPTYNRSSSLARTLRSILAVSITPEHQIRVLAVDNRSKDDTRAVIESFSRTSGGIVQYVAEQDNQGRSFALNTGIRAAGHDLLAFLDDDEEVAPDWFAVVFSAFADPRLDYIGGRYLPRWEIDPPAWVNHPHTRTAIGWADFGESRRPFSDPGFDALLMGGNCAFRRTCVEKVGFYSTALGRTGTLLLAGEDADMHDRLIAAELIGLYLPELIVYHHIPASRLQKSYMRRWAFWASVSNGRRLKANALGPVWMGLPRYMYGKVLRSPLEWLTVWLTNRQPATLFHHELTLWRFAGSFYGRHFFPDGQPMPTARTPAFRRPEGARIHTPK